MTSLRLFDCFTFNNELDLLELRLRTSAPFVDVFVLVEATRTFSGAKKPLHYQLNSARFAQWHSKLTHIVVEDMLASSVNRWTAEIMQRNALTQGLEGAHNMDVILVSDVDEIAHPGVLASLRRGVPSLTALEMRSTFRFANWRLPPGPYAGAARAMAFGELVDPHRQRNHVRATRLIRDAGYHYTALGPVSNLVDKFESYSHSEMDNAHQKAISYLERAEQMGVDVFSRKLVSVVGASALCATQVELSRIRPDWFDFSGLPSRRQRELFRWYANWRARRPGGSELVPALDSEYEDRLPTVASKAALELARHVTWTIPRRGARTLRERLA